MTTIWVPVEVDEHDLATLLANRATGMSNVPDPNARIQQGSQEEDPWATSGPGSSQPQNRQGSPQGNQSPPVPRCQHGDMRYVPAGYSQRNQKSYPAFWACPADRNDPSKCKGIPA